MCDRIAVMDHGVALQVGRPEEIYETPHSRFVADFIGETNFIPGKVDSVNGQSRVWCGIDDDTVIEADARPGRPRSRAAK